MIRKTIVGMIIVLYLCCYFPVLPAGSAVLSSSRIAFVDIERVFDEYGGTRDAKKKISEQIRMEKEEIIKMEVGIREIEKSMSEKKDVITGLIQGGMESPGPELGFNEPPADTGTARAEKKEEITDSTGTIKLSRLEVLEKKKGELKERLREIKEGLLDTGSIIRGRIMGHIYDVIREIAEEEGFCIVLNKEDVLFSEEESIDITDKVIQRLNK